MQPSDSNRDEPLPAAWKWAFGLTAAASTLVKLYMAYATRGSDDVLAFTEFLAGIREHGGIGTYGQVGSFGNPFNHTPFIVHLLGAFGRLADATGVPFKFWLRLLPTLADLPALWLTWQILGPAWRRKTANRAAFLVMIVGPVAVWISGYHGNFDAVMICLVVLSVYLLDKRGRVGLAGLAFGAAMTFKVVPVIFAPAVFFYLPDLRRRAAFFLCAGAYFVAASLPYLLQAPVTIARAMFGYASIYGNWGWSLLLVNWLGVNPRIEGIAYKLAPPHDLILVCGKYALLAALVAASFWMNRRREKPPLFLQCGAIAFLFMFLTPGYGAQYQSWLIPWVVALGLVPALTHQTVNGLFLGLAYSCWEFWDFYLSGCRHVPFNFMLTVCWLLTLFVLIYYYRALRSPRHVLGEPNRSRSGTDAAVTGNGAAA